MKFRSLFNKIKSCEKSDISDDYEITNQLINQLEKLGTSYYNPVISTIIGVQSEGKIRKDGHNQVMGEMYKHEPLLGLYKSHTLDSSLRSTFMNMNVNQSNLRIIDDQDSLVGVDIDFIDSEIEMKEFNKYCESYKKYNRLTELTEKDLQKCIEEYTEKYGEKCLKNYQKKSSKNKINGNWLVFGKLGQKNIYLYLHMGFDHTEAGDEKLYQQLINFYSEDYISLLKSGKRA